MTHPPSIWILILKILRQNIENKDVKLYAKVIVFSRIQISLQNIHSLGVISKILNGRVFIRAFDWLFQFSKIGGRRRCKNVCRPLGTLSPT